MIRFFILNLVGLIMKIEKVETIKEGKWLSLKKAIYYDKNGKLKEWEFASRNNKIVVMMLCKQKKSDKILFISQPRPPINKHVISIPGGLVEEKETPEQTALRELKEETGYKGKVINKSPLSIKSAGFGDEFTYLVEIEVNEKDISAQKLEETEEISLFWMSPNEFYEKYKAMDTTKEMIEYDTWTYIVGCISSKK
jgi:8-oxo-dGTP pyrophosphatase MutT (NUDIX family)